eukprot:CAMPEP_0171305240 /NCGR_PEP_ID=MMETSP0816-20121228/15041_1 /TAXON_ID=420281 /ORGANISM="Proboscia inermis, Strain CCAP1064/1" /LENGTH=85 /DNA_ID=CAMNT_0011785911 /DNA_START=524 /DNA_END=778 /DNA_ORIENTATION=-
MAIATTFQLDSSSTITLTIVTITGVTTTIICVSSSSVTGQYHKTERRFSKHINDGGAAHQGSRGGDQEWTGECFCDITEAALNVK